MRRATGACVPDVPFPRHITQILHVMPRVRARCPPAAPEPLPRVLESAQLEHETGNSNSRIVGGDGLEVNTIKPACEEMAAGAELMNPSPGR